MKIGGAGSIKGIFLEKFSAKICDDGGDLTMHVRNVNFKFYFNELQY
uniref:Uncharacterized protein n=1 Tax=Solanum lycopersicum TaxID=4081 RepID=A0A3Q7HAW1_SOLLC